MSFWPSWQRPAAEGNGGLSVACGAGSYMLHYILSAVQFITCACIIGLVLIQRGKGADAGAGFGAGASGTVFGARGAGTALSRATAVLVAVFMLNSLALAYMGTKQAAAPKTIFDTA